MTETNQDLEKRRFAWSRTGFDLEGIVGAVAAWLVGVLLGLLWDPLFWLGVIGAVLILLATRRASRVPPADARAIVAPVDGVVTEVLPMNPPPELRLDGGDMMRVRVASAPSSRNGVYAPIAGELETVIVETGDPSVVIAVDAEAHGLAAAFLTIKDADGEQVGVRLATGGLGPRLDLDVEPGDPVRLGRKIGQRRLGGWCDIYLPVGMSVAVWPGMTVVGAETRLVAGAPPEAGGDELARADVTSHSADIEPPAGSDEPSSEDPAELFARLRSKVKEASADGESDVEAAPAEPEPEPKPKSMKPKKKTD